MKILVTHYHWFCEQFMYELLSEHQFYLFGKHPLLPLPPNVKEVWQIPDDTDVAITPFLNMLSMLRWKGIRTVFLVDQWPPDPQAPKVWREIVQETPTLYWSEEEAQAWGMGIPFIRYHPIDANVFSGYNPAYRRAIFCASRPLRTWGEVKGFSLMRQLSNEVEVQIVAGSDPDFAFSSETIWERPKMIATLAAHACYANTAWKLDRTALEAMCIGLPVVTIRKPQNTYLGYLKHGENILVADTEAEFVGYVKDLLAYPKMCQRIGQQGRETVKAMCDPQKSKETLLRALG